MTNGPGRSCVFCGGRPVTREHVYPRWLYRALGAYGQGRLVDEQQRLIRRTTEFDIRLKEVCGPCNHGWLHDLERAFRAILGPSLTGQSTVLPKPAQLVAATWIVKTWALVERVFTYGRPQWQRLPPEFFRELRLTNAPPALVQVFIGAISPGNEVIKNASRVVGAAGLPPIGITGIFSIGHLLFQVFVPYVDPSSGTFRELHLGSNMTPFLRQIWPNEVEEVRWPPVGILTAEDFDAIWLRGGPIEPLEFERPPNGM